MLDFPNAPTVGQKFPSSPIVGIPSYTWDGEKWTTAVGTASGGLAVLYDKAQSLTALNQQQGRQNIYAAPFDAMAYSGLQINGGMEVSQERGGAGIQNAAGYICDGWRIGFGGSMGFNALADGSGGNLFYTPYRLLVTTSTAQASLGANDYIQIQQWIEGWRCARLQWGTINAQPLTIAFWTAHHRTGVYSVSVHNSADGRSYSATYTQNVADIAQYNVITIPGDTLGTWLIDNTVGLKVLFSLGCGSSLIAPSPNTWLSGNYLAAPGQINGVAATSDTFRITGVTVLPGSEAPSAARSPFVMRSYQDELLICKRYFYNGILPLKGVTGGVQPWAQRMGFPHPVAMRASPTVIIPATISFLDGSQILQSAGVTTNYSTPLALEVDCQTNVVGVAGRAMVVSIGGSTGNITVDARL